MSWNDLLRALADEAEREAGAVRAVAEGESARVLDEARRAVASERERALADAGARHAAARRRALAGAARERERALLEASREALAGVRAGALARAVARGPARTAALVEALAAEAGDREAEWTVDPGDEEVARAVLARLGRPATVRAAAAPRGGPEVVIEGRVALDATAEARLSRAWDDAEPEVCALVFGAGEAGEAGEEGRDGDV